LLHKHGLNKPVEKQTIMRPANVHARFLKPFPFSTGRIVQAASIHRFRQVA